MFAWDCLEGKSAPLARCPAPVMGWTAGFEFSSDFFESPERSRGGPIALLHHSRVIFACSPHTVIEFSPLLLIYNLSTFF